jgi:integrase
MLKTSLNGLITKLREVTMAIVRQRSGIAHIQARDPKTGKSNSVTTGLENIPENKAQIQLMKEKVELEIAEAILLKKRIGGKMLMKNLIDAYLNSSLHLAESTQRNRAKVFVFLKHKIKAKAPVAKYVNQVAMSNLVNFIYGFGKLSKSTKAAYVKTLFDLVSFSNEQGYTNHVTISKSLKPARPQSNPNPFNDETLRVIFTYPDIMSDHKRLAHAYICLYQGLRMNEAINIDPDKIDFPNNRMTIYFSKTKNQRVVPIHLVIVGILKYLISIKGKSTKLFDCTYDHMSHIFHDVLCELGLRVKGFKYYSLRSTHVTMAKFNGVRDDAQAYWLGHSLGGTRSKYYHKEVCASAATEMRKIYFDIPNYFEVIGMVKEAEEVKKTIKDNRLELAKEMFPEIFGKLKPEDLV